MTFATMQHIPLTSAYLCQDCNSVGNCATHCPACASVVLLGLSGILNREEDMKAEQLECLQMPAYAA
jgi:ferredoxin